MTSNDFWIVVPYFDVTADRARARVALRVVEELRRYGSPVAVVEAALPDQPFVFTAGPLVYQLRVSQAMWLKENLVNYAIRRLPQVCKFVAWIDSDISFPSNTWLSEARELLATCDVIQLFECIADVDPESDSLRHNRGPRIPGFFSLACNLPLDEAYSRVNAPGGAIAARREILGDGLYDKCILGGADSLFARAAFNSTTVPSAFDGNNPIFADFSNWMVTFQAARMNPSCGYLPQEIHHFRHGDRKRRGYLQRQQILKAHSFDPRADLEHSDSGVLHWVRRNDSFQNDIDTYFKERRDADLPSETEERDSWIHGLDLRGSGNKIMTIAEREEFVKSVNELRRTPFFEVPSAKALQTVLSAWHTQRGETELEIDASSLESAWSSILEHRPANLLQLGAGLATLVLAVAAERIHSRVRTFEFDFSLFLNTRIWSDVLRLPVVSLFQGGRECRFEFGVGQDAQSLNAPEHYDLFYAGTISDEVSEILIDSRDYPGYCYLHALTREEVHAILRRRHDCRLR